MDGTWANGFITRIALRLDVNPIQAKSVLPNYNIHTFVASATDYLRRSIVATAITHGNQYFHDQRFEKCGLTLQNPIYDVSAKHALDLLMRTRDYFIRRGVDCR